MFCFESADGDHFQLPETSLWLCFQVDGGLGPSTIDVPLLPVVAGSSIFGAADPGEVISVLKKSVVESQGKI
jgi:ribulose-phosphate 3-epimerase